MGYVDELRKRKEREAGVASKQQRTPPRTLTPAANVKVTEKPKTVSPPPVQGPQKPTSADLKAAQPKPPEPIKPINKQEKTQQIRYDRHKEQAAKTGMQIKPVEERQQAERAASYLFNADGTRKLGKDASNTDIKAWLGTIEDEKLRSKYTAEFEADLLNPKSHRFDPYAGSGSNNLDAVARFGQTSFDRSFFTPENDQKYLSLLEYGTPGGSPLGATKRGTRSTKEYGDALAYFYLKKYDLPRTEQAQEELSNLNRAIALRASQGGSADEIFKDLVDSENFADNYKMLGEMRDAQKSYTWKLTTAGVPVSDDSIKAAINAALRGEDISAVRDYTADEVNQLNATMTGTVNRNRIEMQRERFAARDARMGRTRQTLDDAVQEGPKGYGLTIGGADERQDVLVAGEPWTPPTPPTQQSWDEQHDVIQAGSDGYTQAPPEAVEIPNATEPPGAATMPLPNSVEPARAADAQTPSMGMARADEADARAVAPASPAPRPSATARDAAIENRNQIDLSTQAEQALTDQLTQVDAAIQNETEIFGAPRPETMAHRDALTAQLDETRATKARASEIAPAMDAASTVATDLGKQFALEPEKLDALVEGAAAGEIGADEIVKVANDQMAYNYKRGGTARINYEMAAPEQQEDAIRAKAEQINDLRGGLDALSEYLQNPEFVAGLNALKPVELPEGVTDWAELGLSAPPQNPGLYGPEHMALSDGYDNDPSVRAAVNEWLLFGMPTTQEEIASAHDLLDAYEKMEQTDFGLGDMMMDTLTDGRWTTVGGITNDGVGLAQAVSSGVQLGLLNHLKKYPQLGYMLSSGMDKYQAWLAGKTEVEYSQATEAMRKSVQDLDWLTSAEMQFVFDNGTQFEVAATSTVAESVKLLASRLEGAFLGDLAGIMTRWTDAAALARNVRFLQTLPISSGIMGQQFYNRFEQDGKWLKSFGYALGMAAVEQMSESGPTDRFITSVFGEAWKPASLAGINSWHHAYGAAGMNWLIGNVKSANAEGIQEIISGIGGAGLDRLMYGDGGYSGEEAVNDYIGGFQVALLLNVAGLPNMFKSAAYLNDLRKSNQQITNDQWHTLAVLYAGDKLGPNAAKAFEAAGQFSDNIDRDRAILQVMGENITQLDKAEGVKAAQQAADRATAAVDAIDTKIQQEQGRQSEAEDLIRSIKSKVAAGEITALESLPEFERLREIAQDAKGNQINFMTQRRDAQALAQQAEEGLKTSRLASLDELRSMAAGIVDQEIEKAQSLVADIAAWTDQLFKSGQGMAAESLQASNVAQQDSEYSDVRKIGLPKGEQKRVGVLDRLAQNIRDAAADLNATHFKDWIWQKADALKGLAEYDAQQQRVQADAELDAQLGGELDAAAQVEAADMNIGAEPEIDYSDRGEAGADTPIPIRSRAVGEIYDAARTRTNAAFEATGEQTDAAITESVQAVDVPTVQDTAEADVEAQSSEVAQLPAEDPQAMPTTFNSLHSEAAAPRVDDFVPSATARQQGVRRASQTAKDLYGALGIRSTQRYQPATMRAGETLGEYNIRSGVVTTRSAQAIQPHAHEIGHAIFDRAGVFEADNMTPRAEYRADFDRMRNNLPADFVQRYTDAGQDAALYHEAGAEFMARYLTSREQAVAFAGEAFVNRFENSILNKDQLGAMNKARDEFRAQMDADGVEQNKAMLDSHRNRPTNRRWWSSFLTNFADKYHWALDFDAEARKQGLDNSSPAARIYTKLSNLGYSSDRANSIVLDALRTPDGRMIGAGMTDILSGINYRDEADFNTYLLLLHDVDRQREGTPIFPGQTAEESAQRARTLESLHPEFRETQKKLMAWWRNFTQAWLVDTNAIPNAAARFATANRMYPNYVPTFRSFVDSQDEFAAVMGLDRGGALVQAMPTLKRATGGDQAIYRPVENMVLRVQSIVAATEKVLAMRQMHDMVQQTPGQFGDYVREVEFNPTAVQQVQDTDLMRIIDADGVEHYYQIMDPVMYNALMVPPKERGKVFEFFSAISHTFKSLTTMNNIMFAISNTMRDFKESYQKGSSWTMIDHALDFGRALGEVAASNLAEYVGIDYTPSTLADYAAMGGGDTSVAPEGAKGVRAMESALYGHYFSDTFGKLFSENVRGVDKARGVFDGIRASISKLNDAILMVNNTVETAQRYSEFRRQRGLGTANALKRVAGMDVSVADMDVAFRAAMDVTTDFRRSGNSDVMPLVGNIFMFANAGIQGTYNVYRMARDGQYDMPKLINYIRKSVTAHVVVPLLIHALINRDEDDKEAYELVAEDIKRDNWLIPAHYAGGKRGMFIKIPNEKGLPSAIGESIAAAIIQAYDKEGGDWGEFWRTTGQQLTDSVNPYGSPLYAPIVEIMMNRTWWGGPIENEWQRKDNVSPKLRVKDSDSSVAVWLANLQPGEGVLSPSQIDYFIDQSFGIAGDLALSEIGETMLGKLQGEGSWSDVGEAAKTAAGRMILSRVRTDPTTSTDVNSQMYEMRDLFTGIVADIEADGKSPRLGSLPPEQQKQIAKEFDKQLKKGGMFYQAGKNNTKYWDEIAAVKASKLSKTEQEDQIFKIKYRMAIENLAVIKQAEAILRKAKGE